MATAQEVYDVHKLMTDDPTLSKRMLQLMAKNFNQYTEPFNLLPHWLSELLGGATMSASWFVSNLLPITVAAGSGTAMALIYRSKEPVEKRESYITDLQTVLTVTSVAYALFTFGRMQYTVRQMTDRLLVTTSAFMEYAVANGKIDLKNTKVLDPDLFRRLPKRVQGRFLSGELRNVGVAPLPT